jgi:hypothetical protein
LNQADDWLVAPVDSCSADWFPAAGSLADSAAAGSVLPQAAGCLVDSPRVDDCCSAVPVDSSVDSSQAVDCWAGSPHRGARSAPADFRGDSQADLLVDLGLVGQDG